MFGTSTLSKQTLLPFLQVQLWETIPVDRPVSSNSSTTNKAPFLSIAECTIDDSPGCPSPIVWQQLVISPIAKWSGSSILTILPLNRLVLNCSCGTVWYSLWLISLNNLIAILACSSDKPASLAWYTTSCSPFPTSKLGYTSVDNFINISSGVNVPSIYLVLNPASSK